MTATTDEQTQDAQDAVQFPVELINIRHPNELVCLNETIKLPRGRTARQWTGETVQFTETRLIVTDEDTYEQVLAACPYVFIEPRTGKYHIDHKANFQCRNHEAYDAWMNSEWRPR